MVNTRVKAGWVVEWVQERESYHVSNRNKAETEKTRDFIHSFETNRHTNSKKVEKRGWGDKTNKQEVQGDRTGRIFNLPIKFSEYQMMRAQEAVLIFKKGENK